MTSAGGRRWLDGLLAVVMMVTVVMAGGARSLAQVAGESSADPYPLVFPVAGDHNYVDTFGAPRSGGRAHRGTDVFAAKLTPVVAAADGTVLKVAVGKLAGRYIVIQHDDHWRSYYMHLNNDTPGTDDGLGAAPVEGIVPGTFVQAGDLLDFVGDSGNAEDTPPHLHFELHRPDGLAVNPYRHLKQAQGVVVQAVADPLTAAEGKAALEASRSTTAAASAALEYTAVDTALVGNIELGQGFVADVVVSGATAYVGTWGRPGICPGIGIRSIDVSDPERPRPIGAFADLRAFPGTDAETLWVGPVDTPAFTGDLAAVPLRLCDNDLAGRRQEVLRGMAFYDVTDVRAPILLSTWHSGAGTQGANDVSVAQRDDGTLLVAATVRHSLLHTEGALGDIRFIDATDPAVPVELSDWDARRDGNLPGDDDEEQVHAHAVMLAADGLSAWAAHWDGGAILLDLTDPVAPQMVGGVSPAPGGEGNVHSIAFDGERAILVTNAEDLFPAGGSVHVAGWGGQRIYDVSDPAAPVDIAEFATAHSTTADGTAIGRDGFYSAHDTVLAGSVAVSSWYSDGVRVVDLSDPGNPVEIGSFVPPPAVDPMGYWTAPDGSIAFPMVWGVDAQDDLIFLTDVNSGLWIVRQEADDATASTVSESVRHQ